MWTLCSRWRLNEYLSASFPLFLNTEHEKQNWVTTWACCHSRKNGQAASQLKAFPPPCALERILKKEEKKERTLDTHDREKKRKDKNSDGCSSDGIKWYKAENSESIVVFCQAEGVQTEAETHRSVRTHFIAITANTCGSQGTGGREGGGRLCCVGKEREKKGSINLFEIWPEFTAHLLVNNPLSSSALPWCCA